MAKFYSYSIKNGLVKRTVSFATIQDYFDEVEQTFNPITEEDVWLIQMKLDRMARMIKSEWLAYATQGHDTKTEKKPKKNVTTIH